MKTKEITNKDIKRKHYIIDANGKILGRLATKVATLLSGKTKRDYTPNVDNGDFVIIINANKVTTTGSKLLQKKYTSYSGYPGGLKIKTLEYLMDTNPVYILRHAVKGMLPKTRLGSRMITRLKVYARDKHPHQAQQPEEVK